VVPFPNQKSAARHYRIAYGHDLQGKLPQSEKWGYKEGERREFYFP